MELHDIGNTLRDAEMAIEAKYMPQNGPMNDEELRDKIGKLGYDHHLDNFSENLGQYKSKYSCICGLTFITDGHDPLEIGSEARFSFHILDEQMELVKERDESRDQQIALAAQIEEIERALKPSHRGGLNATEQRLIARIAHLTQSQGNTLNEGSSDE